MKQTAKHLEQGTLEIPRNCGISNGLHIHRQAAAGHLSHQNINSSMAADPLAWKGKGSHEACAFFQLASVRAGLKPHNFTDARKLH